MTRFKLLMENFIVYGIGGAIGKIIPFLMLPIITRLMPDPFFLGVSDNVIVLISFGSSFATMGMYDAMFRMFFEKNDENYKKEICSTALMVVSAMAIFVIVAMCVFRKYLSNFFFSNSNYQYLIIIAAFNIFIAVTGNIISAPTRMQNKRGIYLAANSLTPLIAYSITIVMLFKEQYILALPVGSLVSSLLQEGVFLFLNKKWFCLKFNKEYIKTLLKIALPLLPGALIYWVFNSSDRIMITNFLGAKSTGIYSVGAKIGHVSNLIYMAFAGGWQYFAFSTMHDLDQVELTSKILEYLGVITFSAGIIMVIFYESIFSVLFTGEYLQGAITVPYLFLSPLLLMLFQVGSNQFLVIKKTMPSTLVLCFGAITNVVINFVLIPRIGIEGAAIGTMLGYGITDVLCIFILHKKKLLKLSKKFILCVMLFCLYFVLWRMFIREHIVYKAILGFLIIIIYILFYLKKQKSKI